MLQKMDQHTDRTVANDAYQVWHSSLSYPSMEQVPEDDELSGEREEDDLCEDEVEDEVTQEEGESLGGPEVDDTLDGRGDDVDDERQGEGERRPDAVGERSEVMAKQLVGSDAE